MKFTITMKDPDGVWESVQDAAKDSLVSALEGLSKKESDGLIEARVDSIHGTIGKWVDGGEYITVEFDTDAGTATVVKL